jgi:PAS domain S-box-containing protein
MNSADELERMRAVAMKNAQTVLQVREQARTDMLQAQDALEQRSSELAQTLSLLRATLESTADAIMATDRSGRIIHCNAAFLSLCGQPREQVIGVDHRELAARTAPRVAISAADALALLDKRYEQPPNGETDVVQRSDGLVLERISKSQVVNGEEVGRVWTYRDITDRRRHEEILREERGVLEMLNRTGKAIGSTLEFEALLQLITDTATELSGAQFGSFFCNTIGTDGEAVMLHIVSGAPREAFASFGHPRATPLFGPNFHGEGPICIADVLEDPRYGQWAPHHGMPQDHLPVRSYLAVPVVTRDNGVIGGLFFGHADRGVFGEHASRVVAGVAAQAAIAIDNARLYEHVKATALENQHLAEAERSARAEAERGSRLKDEFLATLSHELRTPLNAILGWSQILLSGKANKEQVAQGLETIARNAKAQTRLIEDLLDMHSIISGKVRLDVQHTDLAMVVDAAVESLRPAADAKEIRLRKIIDPLAGPVCGDPNRLQQVVWNLLSNAIKFTPKNGKVEVLLERVNSHLEITVADDGDGIAAEFLPHVFDRFRQADSSTTRRYGGLGLGLSIVRQLIELHGGNVRAKSPGEGQGSTFIVALPLAAVRGNATREHPGTSQSGAAPAAFDITLDGITVLVVDDERDARELIRNVLEESGAKVLLAPSASDALRGVQQHRPDVIVSDIGMPELDGYQFIRALRRLPAEAGGNTPALALTAFARSEDRTRAIVAGYQMHIAKPIEPQELLAVIASIAGRMPMSAED